MKSCLLLLIVSFSIGLYGQNLSEINQDIHVPDSLVYNDEVRVYQGGGITNYSSLFRMYKDANDHWIAEFYEHFAKIDGITELKTEKRDLVSKSEMEYIFHDLIRSHILDLPTQSEIRWKMVTRGNIEKVEKIRMGQRVEEYELLNKHVGILDGEGFVVQVSGWNKKNEFEYSNPDRYLELYSEVDELIFMCEILDIIRSEFQIWNRNE